MVIQLLIILIAIVLYIWFSHQIIQNKDNYDIVRRNYIVILFVLMILQSGLRNIAVGPDTYAYRDMFMMVSDMSWSQLLNNYRTVYVEGTGKDPGYNLLVKIFQLFSTDYQIFIFSVAVLFFTALGRLLYRTSTNLQDVLLCVITYQVLFYGFFSITGVRQTIATAILLLSYKSILNRKFLQFCIYCLIAIQIHKSALLFFPVYFFINDKRPYRVLVISLCLSPILLVFGRQIAIILTSTSLTESYAAYANSTYETSGAQMFMLFMVIFTTMILIARNNIIINYNMRISLTAFSVGLMLTPLTWIDPSIMRAITYFSIFLLLIIGKICNAVERHYDITNSAITVTLIIVFIYVIISRNSHYSFFWQNITSSLGY